MKKYLMVLLLIFVCISVVFAQNVETRIKQAVDGLSVRLNFAMDVSLGSLTRDGVDTPSAFSRWLSDKISHNAVNNSLFNVIAPTRGMPSSRPSVARNGIISGTYFVRGNSVDVTLQLSSNNSVVNSQNFTITVAELTQMGISIEPPNQHAVQEREQILEQLKVPIAQDNTRPVQEQNTASAAFEITAWPNTDSFTFIEGDELRITILSNRNCYFKVYHIDINNQMQLIYPNSANTNNYLQANVQRTIPEAPIQYVIEPPFGQDTIVVVASGQQFSDIRNEIASASRGVGVRLQNLPDNNQIIAAGTVSTRFSFTSLSSSYYDNTFSYERPNNITEAIQAIRANIQQNGGTFNGNEREGTFSVGGTTGKYTVTANAIIFNIRNGNEYTATRSAGLRFSIDRPRDIGQAINSVRAGIERKGGVFNGNDQSGNFSASGIIGQYNISERVDINISRKPLAVPNSFIEREIRSYFSGR
ncbi:MAG: DUF4384 domain-containing protein [Treponema sp.]|nr:DUF4384 domain-containing protein [Treponema sp.]